MCLRRYVALTVQLYMSVFSCDYTYEYDEQYISASGILCGYRQLCMSVYQKLLAAAAIYNLTNA
jgi:hypothetical protein